MSDAVDTVMRKEVRSDQSMKVIHHLYRAKRKGFEREGRGKRFGRR